MFRIYGMENEKRKPNAIMEFKDHRAAVQFMTRPGVQNLSRCCPTEHRRYYRQCQAHDIKPTRIFRVGSLVFALGHERHRRERKERKN